ncbi:MAG TPA: Cof-type HAD-IIB family hydrolase [Chloroflexi bacterium]|nr:Cof-type HAD-IIB family hydrolase [Chloroflexota bacterium]
MSGANGRWLIALDLDGTLFGDDLVIAPRVRRAIAAAQAAGHLVTLATGRSFATTQPIAADLGLSDPLITYQGAVVRTPGEIIWQRTLTLEVARRALHFSEARALPTHVYLPEGVFAARRTPETSVYEAMHPGVRIQFVGSLSAFLTVGPIKLLLILDPARTDAVLRELTSHLGSSAAVVRSHSLFVEVTHPTVSKGQALLALAARAGIPRQRTLGIGDNHNDLPLIAAAGVGVAMGNATATLKALADWVAPSVQEDGAAVAIERFILGSLDCS